MKPINSSSIPPERRDTKENKVEDISLGVTIRLLEKYKHNKELSVIKSIKDRQDKKKTA